MDTKMMLEMERIDLISKLEAFNKKAELLGIEPIPFGEQGSDLDSVSGKEFEHCSDAKSYLEKMGWEHVAAYSEEYMKGGKIAKVEKDYSKSCSKWTIVVQ